MQSETQQKQLQKVMHCAQLRLEPLALYAAYSSEITKLSGGVPLELKLSDPMVLVGLLIGGMIPFLFASFLMGAVEELPQQ